jgi:hypothetical protein
LVLDIAVKYLLLKCSRVKFPNIFESITHVDYYTKLNNTDRQTVFCQDKGHWA